MTRETATTVRRTVRRCTISSMRSSSPALKKRILGDYGHLSNEACASALLKLIAGGTGTVILGHLSGENNTPGLARRVSEKTLAQEGIRPGTDVQLQIALRDETGEVYCIQENSKA